MRILRLLVISIFLCSCGYHQYKVSVQAYTGGRQLYETPRKMEDFDNRTVFIIYFDLLRSGDIIRDFAKYFNPEPIKLDKKEK